jgi:hypothetical protein
MKAESRRVYKRGVFCSEDAIGSVDMAEDMKLGAYPRHRVQLLPTPFVQTGDGCSIEDAEGRPTANQNIDVLGNPSIQPFAILGGLSPKAPPYKGVTGEPHIRNPSISVPSLIRTSALSNMKRVDESASRKNS